MASPQSITESVAQAKAELARRNLADYCALMDDSFVLWPHTKQIVEHLEALERREIQKLMLFVPIQHGKSYLASQRFPTWYLGRHPKHRIILASHTADLAHGFARQARTLMQDNAYPFPVKLAQDSTAVAMWHTQEGGYLKSIGVGGALSGYSAEILGIDDPFKGSETADSPAFQDSAWTWYTTIAQRRLQRNGLEYMLTTRWNERDLAGMILSTPAAKQWTILRLPVYDANGTVLWPEGPEIPKVELGQISSRHFQAIYMQDPQPDEGIIFKREWIANAPRWSAANPPAWESMTSCSYLDGAGKPDKTVSQDHDFSAYVVWYSDGHQYYLRNGWHGKYDYPDLKAKALASYHTDRPSIAAVEDASSGTPLIQEMRRSGIPLSSDIPRGDKVLRAKSVTPLFEAGMIVLPEDGPEWFDEWVAQHLRFGAGGAHDDYVDTDQALIRLQTKTTYAFAKL